MTAATAPWRPTASGVLRQPLAAFLTFLLFLIFTFDFGTVFQMLSYFSMTRVSGTLVLGGDPAAKERKERKVSRGVWVLWS